MKALVTAVTSLGENSIVVSQVSDPVPAAGQVVVRVHTTTVNYADFKQVRDWSPAEDEPLVPGHEVVGTVASVGSGVTDLTVGQRVGALTTGGSFCELALAERGHVVPLPDDLSDERAVGLVALGTAYNALVVMGRLVSGERVLVNAAAGGIGSTVVQMARALGAAAIVGLVGTDKKVAVVDQAGGVGIACDYETVDVTRVIDSLGGEADVIIDSVGGPALASNLRCLGAFGRLVVCGHTGGRWGYVSTVRLQEQHQTVTGYRGRLLLRDRPGVVMDGIAAGLQLVRSKDVEILVDSVLPLDEAREAFRRLQQRESVGKIVLRT